MTANDRRIRQRVQEELVTRGWEELSSPGVLRYGEFYIYLYQEEQDKVRDEVTSFVYDEAELCSGRVLRRPVNYHMNYFLPDYNWWVEYCGVLVAMGRFKKTALSTEKTTKQFLECIEGIDRLAKGGPEKAMLGRPSYSQHTISVMQRTLVPYNGEMRSDIYLQQKDNLYYFVKRISNTEDAPGSIYALVPVVCTTHGDFVDSLLYISSHEEEWEQDMMDLEENCAIAYVFNETDPMMSEIGYIAVKPQFGGVTRIL